MQQFFKAIFRSTLAALVGLLFFLSVASMPSAQDANVQTLIQRLDNVQEDLRILQKDYYRGQKTGIARMSSGSENKRDKGRLADAEIRMSNLEAEMRRLTGQLEDVGHGMQTMLQRLDNLVKDVDFRLTEIEHRLARTLNSAAADRASGKAGNAATTEQEAQNQTNSMADKDPSILPTGTPKERYKYAYSLLITTQWAKAEAAFQEFLEQHGEDKLAGNAQYWLGETYYARQNLHEATRAFLVGIQRYPNSAKAPDTMLKLGISLGKLGKGEDSCAAFLEMQNKFPTLQIRLHKRLLKEIKVGGCN